MWHVTSDFYINSRNILEQGRIQDLAKGGGQNSLRGGDRGDRIQEEGENQVTYQSIGIWMF